MKELLLIATLVLSGCASSVKMEDSFKHKGIVGIPHTAGFVEGDRVVTTYVRYQFIPDAASLEPACRESHKLYAEQLGLKVSDTTVAFGRNGLVGLSSCTATSKLAK